MSKQLFGENPIEKHFQLIQNNVFLYIEKLDESSLIGKDIDKLAGVIAKQFSIEKPNVDFANIDDFDVVMSPEGAVANYYFKIHSTNLELLFLRSKNVSIRKIYVDIVGSNYDKRLVIHVPTSYAKIQLSEEIKSRIKADIKLQIKSAREAQEAVSEDIESFLGSPLITYIKELLSNRIEYLKNIADQVEDMKNL